MRVALVAIILIYGVTASAAAPPKLSDYRVKTIFKGKVAAPVLDTKQARMFRTELRRQAATGPNFAAHFTLAQWGCGAGCSYVAVIDAITGQVYVPTIQFDSVLSKSGQPTCYISSKADLQSELFIVQGQVGDEVGRPYFHWKNGQFKLVHFEPTCVDSADEF